GSGGRGGGGTVAGAGRVARRTYQRAPAVRVRAPARSTVCTDGSAIGVNPTTATGSWTAPTRATSSPRRRPPHRYAVHSGALATASVSTSRTACRYGLRTRSWANADAGDEIASAARTPPRTTASRRMTPPQLHCVAITPCYEGRAQRTQEGSLEHVNGHRYQLVVRRGQLAGAVAGGFQGGEEGGAYAVVLQLADGAD